MVDTLLSEQSKNTENLGICCPVCHSVKWFILGSVKYALFDNEHLENKYKVVSCASCGFVQNYTPSTQNDYDEFYKSSFYSTEYIERSLTGNEKQYFNQTADLLAGVIEQRDLSIFDIGCGVGYLLETLQTHGYSNLFGVDPSLSCVALLNNKMGIKSEQGSIFAIPFHNQFADIIILSHIIEHLLDPETALQSVANKLAPNGKVYVEVPDSTRYEEFSNGCPLRFFYFQHIIHFDKHHLRNLFLSKGFVEIASGSRERDEKGFVMPCIWGVYQKDDKQDATYSPNTSVAIQINHWIDECSLDAGGVFRSLAERQVPVYLWGIGIHAQMMLAMSPLRDCNIRAYVDKNEKIQKKTINGQKIESIDTLKKAAANEVVVIAAVVHKDKMYQYLMEELNFKGQVVIF
ncbi:MAG: class I SAM-dependent methyltransferase [Candidatus Brocadiales bacterium]|nr:class I SAM-dependent methyltransferase [Candidatus Brocadiales bacterium]